MTISPHAGSTAHRLVRDRFASRLFAQDASLWGGEASAEASVRLGWVDFVDRARATAAEIARTRSELTDAGITRVVLCGMGGSSLAPTVIARRDRVPLDVLDSTHPEAVSAALAGDLRQTLVVISSKSGTTVETLSHREIFIQRLIEEGLDPAQHMVVVTDPGSPLAAAADISGQRVFHADPHVGGRFSALTAFGLVPAGLAGADIETLITEAESFLPLLREDRPENPAIDLADAIISHIDECYVLEMVEDPEQACGLGMWIEQLIAESTGKEGTGILPLALPTNARPTSGAPARTVFLAEASTSPHLAEGANKAIVSRFPHGGLSDISVTAPLGAQFLLWEVATAAVGRALQVDPFNQPDVESAKRAARENLTNHTGGDDQWRLAVTGAEVSGVPSETPHAVASITAPRLLEVLREGIPNIGYLAIQAYTNPGDRQISRLLAQLRSSLADAWDVPVSLGWGPRYLHSVGQFHKGGRPLGTFLQVIDIPNQDVTVPPGSFTFSELMRAQASGDARVLRSRGRPVLRMRSTEIAQALSALLRAV